jgi:hypothetical protein
LLWLADTDAMFARIQEFLAEARDTPGRVGVVATILHTHLAGTLAGYHHAAGRDVAAFRGRLLSSAGGLDSRRD